MDKQGILSWPNPSPETVLFFSGRVEPPHSSQDDLRDDLSVNSYCRVEMDEDREEVSAVSSCPCVSDSVVVSFVLFTVLQVGEVQALLCPPPEMSSQQGEGPELSETSHDNVCSSDTVRRRRPCQPATTRTKHHSGSNVSFSRDTEGGEDDQVSV